MINEIFNAITPENIKNIPLMKDAMDVFIDAIEEHCDISQDIKNIFNPQHTIIREEFIKIYLDDLYRYFTKAKTNKVISDRIDRVNEIYGVDVVNRDFIGDLTTLFNDEHFITSKAFKQKKGTKVGIEYIYNLVESMVFDDPALDSSFEFIPGEPFQFQVEGSLYKDMYDHMVKPLAHPLGFTYVYLQIVKLTLEDMYQIRYVYKNIEVEVRCLDGENDIYDGDDVVDIKEYIDGTRRVTEVIFENGNYLQQKTNPIHVVFFDQNDVIIKDYGESHCSLFLKYDSVLEILTDDSDLKFKLGTTFADDWYRDEFFEAIIGEITVGQFHVGASGVHIFDDFIEMMIDYDTREEVTYELEQSLLGFIIGQTYLGGTGSDKLIGIGYESITRDTTDVYDLRIEVQEEFTIELI